MTSAEDQAAEVRDALTAAYVTDLEPLDDLLPYIRTRAESPYIPLDTDNRQEHQ